MLRDDQNAIFASGAECARCKQMSWLFSRTRLDCDGAHLPILFFYSVKATQSLRTAKRDTICLDRYSPPVPFDTGIGRASRGCGFGTNFAAVRGYHSSNTAERHPSQRGLNAVDALGNQQG